MKNVAQKSLITLLLCIGMAFLYQGCKLNRIAARMEDQRALSSTNLSDTAIRLVFNGRTFCSGVVLTNKVIATASHCVMAAFEMRAAHKRVEIRSREDKPTGIFAEPTWGSPQMDTGIMSGDFHLFPKHQFNLDPYFLQNAVKITPYLIICGYPMGGDLYCVKTYFEGPEGFQWSVPVQMFPGMSGGPGMLPDGTVVSVTSAMDGNHALIAPIINIPLELVK